VENNTWTRFKDEYEYNNDENGFEIVTKGERKVVFHLELENGVASFEGVFYSKNPRAAGKITGVECYFDPTYYSGKRYGNVTLLGLGNFRNAIGCSCVTPLSKYPREKYLGVRAVSNEDNP
jgi:hypothetical protein